jgi:hypothetical protein
MLFIQQNREEMQARKLITYHFFCLLSFGTHGIASVARLQREETPTTQQDARGTGTFPTGIYKSWHPLSEFEILQDTSQNLLEVLHLSKYSTANLIEFELK